MGVTWRYFPFARIYAIRDGDTLSVEVDSGFGASHKVHVRLFGVSAPEMSGAEREWGLRALDAGKRWIGYSCRLWTWKQSFDRYVGRLTVGEADVARSLVAGGWALAWDGRTARPRFTEYPVARAAEECVEYDRLLARDFGA